LRNSYKILVETPEEGEQSSDLSVEERLLLKWIVKKQSVKM
jgi:hypothetical protein